MDKDFYADNEIMHFIKERFHEHHPFKRSSEGLRHFAILVKVASSWDDNKRRNYLIEIEKLSDFLGNKCNSCQAKLYVFLLLLSSDKARQDKYKELIKQFQSRISDSNYFEEVFNCLDEDSQRWVCQQYLEFLPHNRK